MGTAKMASKIGSLFTILTIYSSTAFGMPVANCANKGMSDVADLRAKIQKINIFVADNRYSADREGMGNPLAAIGGLMNETPVPGIDSTTGQTGNVKGQATAFLIAPCYVMTNFHAAFGMASSASSSVTSKFYSFDGSGNPLRQSTVNPVAWGSYGKDDATGGDWAILKIAGPSCVGEKVGWLNFGSLDKTKIPIAKAVMMAGYPSDKKVTQLWVSPDCKIIRTEDNDAGTLAHDCAERTRSSGSPLMIRDKNNIPVVVAMDATSSLETDGVRGSWDYDHSNLAVDTSGAMSSLKDRFPKVYSAIMLDRARMINPAGGPVESARL